MKTHRRVAVSDELDFDNAMANATAAILASGTDRIYSVLMAAGHRFGTSWRPATVPRPTESG